MTNKPVKLYNAIFPIWILIIFPTTWLIVLPANFVIDLLVMLITLKCMKVPDIRRNTFPIIFGVWATGFVADILGSLGLMCLTMTISNVQTPFLLWWNNVLNAIIYNPFKNAFAVLIITILVIISAVSIFWQTILFVSVKQSWKKQNEKFWHFLWQFLQRRICSISPQNGLLQSKHHTN